MAEEKLQGLCLLCFGVKLDFSVVASHVRSGSPGLLRHRSVNLLLIEHRLDGFFVDAGHRVQWLDSRMVKYKLRARETVSQLASKVERCYELSISVHLLLKRLGFAFRQ